MNRSRPELLKLWRSEFKERRVKKLIGNRQVESRKPSRKI